MRVLLLLPSTSYRAEDFLAAADRLGVEVVLGSDRCHVLEEQGAVPLTRDSVVLDLREPAASLAAIEAFAATRPLDAVVAVDDATAVLAADAAARLGLPHNPADAAAATRDKWTLRERLRAAGLPQPEATLLPVDAAPAEAAREAGARVGFPCVLKPRALSASRGVIRADDEASCAAAFARVARLLGDPEIRARAGERARSVLAESFVAGPEVSLEGLLTDGALEVLALFDKPDPLDGPYFEETIYVTPSRLPAEVQRAVTEATAAAARALGLREGSVHAELRLPPGGAPVVIEVAGRSIGGLCARTLRFGTGMSLEEVLLRHALARAGKAPAVPHAPVPGAAGVMMLPIARTGVFHGVDGLDEARAIPGIEEITITAGERREIVALPEGSSYLGFMFARAATPDAVEQSLREAWSRMRVRIAGSLGRAD